MIVEDRSKKFRSAEFIRTTLLSSEEIKSLVGDRIYPVIATQDKGDYILVQRNQYGREQTKTGDYHSVCKVAISIWSDDYDRSLDLTILADEVLEGSHKSNDIFGISSGLELSDSDEGYLDGKYFQALEYIIK